MNLVIWPIKFFDSTRTKLGWNPFLYLSVHFSIVIVPSEEVEGGSLMAFNSYWSLVIG
jgi:hypothetical protein